MTTHSSFLVWKIPWAEEPGRLTVHGVTKNWTWLSDWACTHTQTHTYTHPVIRILEVQVRNRYQNRQMRLLYLDLSPLLLLLDLVGAGGLDLQPPLHSLPDWISRSLCEERIPYGSHHDILVLSSILQLQGGAPNQVDDYLIQGRSHCLNCIESWEWDQRDKDNRWHLTFVSLSFSYQKSTSTDVRIFLLSQMDNSLLFQCWEVMKRWEKEKFYCHAGPSWDESYFTDTWSQESRVPSNIPYISIITPV